jgi:hypothetical protein
LFDFSMMPDDWEVPAEQSKGKADRDAYLKAV